MNERKLTQKMGKGQLRKGSLAQRGLLRCANKVKDLDIGLLSRQFKYSLQVFLTYPMPQYNIQSGDNWFKRHSDDRRT